MKICTKCGKVFKDESLFCDSSVAFTVLKKQAIKATNAVIAKIPIFAANPTFFK